METETRSAAGTAAGSVIPRPGVLPSQEIRAAIREGWITAGKYTIPDHLVQPASLDLRLGSVAWALRCSFLPDAGSTVEEKRAVSPTTRSTSGMVPPWSEIGPT